MRAYLAAIGVVLAALGAAAPCRAEFIEVANPGFPDIHASGAWGDYNNDGRLDLLLRNAYPYALLPARLCGNVGGCFFNPVPAPLNGTAPFPSSNEHPGGGAWADFDRDGDLDIAMSGVAVGGVWLTKLYRNNGNGTFTALVNPLGGSAEIPGGWASACAWGDYDNDGDPDLAVNGALYRNDGGGIFTTVNAGFQPIAYGDVAWGDYDNDGRLDLALCGEYPQGIHHTFIYRNSGNGTFTALPGTGLPPMGDFSAVAWGDYDNDGRLDLALAGQRDNVGGPHQTGVWRNNGNGTFAAVNANLPPLRCASLAWGDYNADGCLDIAAIGTFFGNGAPPLPMPVVFQGNAHGQFTVDQSWMVTCDDMTDYSYARWGDADNDGRLDLYLSWWDGDLPAGTNCLLRNIGDPAGLANSWVNQRPAAPSVVTPSGAVFPGIVTLQWTAPANDETPAAAMTYNLRVGTSPTGCDVVSADTDDTHPSHHELLGNVQNGTFAILRGLPQGTYYWAVQAVDGGYRRSKWSRVGKFVRTNVITKPTPTPFPSAVATGTVPKTASTPTPVPSAAATTVISKSASAPEPGDAAKVGVSNRL